jgi:hypothetical protein
MRVSHGRSFVAGMHLIGVHLAGAHLTGRRLSQACVLEAAVPKPPYSSYVPGR